MIVVDHLSKRYGKVQAVQDLSFTVRQGAVTGFLGPNGSGKSTTLRCIMGLDNPSAGRVLIDNNSYAAQPAPLTKVGALLDGKAFNPKITAYQHLRILAATHGLPKSRINEVIKITGLESVAKKKLGGFSLGMGQRLGIATALLGDPEYLLFDEPVNGLDPDGVKWVRTLMRSLAAEGRTVLVSSHLMSEMSLTADDVVIIGHGKLIDAGPMDHFTADAAHTSVHVSGPNSQAIEAALREAHLNFSFEQPTEKAPTGQFIVSEASSADIGHLLYRSQIEIHQLSTIHSSLEDVFIQLTDDAVDYRMENTAGGNQ